LLKAPFRAEEEYCLRYGGNFMETKIYNQEGQEAGTVKLAEKFFNLSWNSDLVHQVVESMRSNQRTPIAHAKGRGEVRGGGKKPWRQKGTGRARHGSIRSPLWKGGGVTHGPTKEKNYSKKINKKMKRKALLVSLSQKLRDKEILILDKLELKEAKTKEAAQVFKNLSQIKDFENINKKKTLVALAKKDEKTSRALRNLPKVNIEEARNLNALDILSFKYLVILQDGLKTLER